MNFVPVFMKPSIGYCITPKATRWWPAAQAEGKHLLSHFALLIEAYNVISCQALMRNVALLFKCSRADPPPAIFGMIVVQALMCLSLMQLVF